MYAQDEGVHVDTVKAVPGNTSAPFNLDSNGAFVFSPPIERFRTGEPGNPPESAQAVTGRRKAA